MTNGIERLLPQRVLDRTESEPSSRLLCARWRVSKIAHEKKAETLKRLAALTTGERKLDLQKEQLEHLKQANWLKDKLAEMEIQ